MLAMSPHLSKVDVDDTIPTDWEPILDGLVLNRLENVRLATLRTIQEYMRINDDNETFDIRSRFVHSIFVAQFDEVEEHSTIANTIWLTLQNKIPPENLFALTENIRNFCYPLLELQGIDNEYTRYTAAAAIAGTFQLLRDKVNLLTLYIYILIFIIDARKK